MLKRVIKRVVPPWLLRKSIAFATLLILRIKADRIQRIFQFNAKTPEWLNSEMLEDLTCRYPVVGVQNYDPCSLQQRGEAKANELVALSQTGAVKAKRFLEIGCHDGMVGYQLQKLGKSATGIDLNAGNFDEQAINRGVKLLEMNAMKLRFSG